MTENLTIKKANSLISSKQLSPKELFGYYHSNIDKKDEELHSYLEVAGSMTEFNEGPLSGLPIAVKDNICVSGMHATAGSKILEHYVSPYDATAVTRLKEVGAVIIGKTNLDEFAMGASTENSAYGATKNPHNITCVPGGSSGGSTAAVAADLCLAALGSETGGSVRQPASFCGVVGLKPTYGAISRHGLIALTSSLDQIGPIGRCVEDVKILFDIIKGQDPFDATTLPFESPKEIKELSKMTLGLPKEYFELEGLDEKVKESVEKAVRFFEESGAKIKEISLPHTEAGLSTYYVLTPAEASSNLARYDGIKYGLRIPSEELWEQYRNTRGEGLGAEPTRRVLIGTYVLSAGYYEAYYKKALDAQKYIKEDFIHAFEDVDAILTPTTPTTAFKFGEKSSDPLQMYAADVFTVPVNIAGLPALSVPCGKIDGMPVGLQIIAPWRDEELLFALGSMFESNYA